jgi:hypothetical protein
MAARTPHDHGHDHYHDAPVRDREVVVRDGGSPFGAIAAIIGLILVLVIGYFLLQAAGIFGGGGETNINAPSVEIPSDVNVDVNSGGGTQGGGAGG